MMSKTPLLLAIGDSHAQFWTGHDKHGGEHLIPGVDVASVGPALAYNLPREGTKTRGLERIEHIIHVRRREKSLAEYFVLNFGEIDIRAHVVRRAIEKNISLAAAVGKVCENYLSFIRRLHNHGRKIIVFGPPATQIDRKTSNARFPASGSEVDRNMATALFHRRMEDGAKEGEFEFVSILDYLIVPGGRTRANVLYDTTHLGQVVMPFALAEIERITGQRLLNPSGFRTRLSKHRPLVLDSAYEPPILSDISNTLIESRNGVVDFSGAKAVKIIVLSKHADVQLSEDGIHFFGAERFEADISTGISTQKISFMHPRMLRAMKISSNARKEGFQVVSASYGGDFAPIHPEATLVNQEIGSTTLTPGQVESLQMAQIQAKIRLSDRIAWLAARRAAREEHQKRRNALGLHRNEIVERSSEAVGATAPGLVERERHRQARAFALAARSAAIAKRTEFLADIERQRRQREDHHRIRKEVLAKRDVILKLRGDAAAEQHQHRLNGEHQSPTPK